MSSIGKLVKKVTDLDPIAGRTTNKITDKLGIPSISGSGSNNLLDMGATAAGQAADAAAAAQQAAAAKQAQVDAAAAQQTALLNEMNKNYATDLTGENKNLVIAGGSADDAVTTTDALKKRPTTGLASTLGINV